MFLLEPTTGTCRPIELTLENVEVFVKVCCLPDCCCKATVQHVCCIDNNLRNDDRNSPDDDLFRVCFV